MKSYKEYTFPFPEENTHHPLRSYKPSPPISRKAPTMTNGLPLCPAAAAPVEATLPGLTLLALFRASQRVINTDFVDLERENGRSFI